MTVLATFWSAAGSAKADDDEDADERLESLCLGDVNDSYKVHMMEFFTNAALFSLCNKTIGVAR